MAIQAGSTNAACFGEDEIVWYFDDAAIARADTPSFMHDPMYMLVNLAVGGMAGTPSDGLVDGSEMKIDYIKAYSLNTLYLNAGITKERMIGTKTAVSLPTHLVKIGTYTTLGAMAGHLWLLGLAAGAAALVSTWVAKRLLRDMSETKFRTIVVGFMALSGAAMLWQQQETVLAIVGGR
ncbi:hypothetical protein J2Z31_003117 [Sinorhizobium kostiense]|uniref:Probable membrane transporter protein n=2 Tax=Sinorhizobium kostiense TaxID=76747 RepID=A0ABS4R125_9HYPH|nr:hypothetical protein [Sinorhizobium kostiense]